MRKLILCSLFCISNALLFAQTKGMDVEYQKQLRPAVVNDLPFDAKTVEKAIDDTLSKLGYKSTSSKGFTVYKGVRLAELGPDSYDLYFMVDKKSRKDNENSTVTLMLTKGFDAFVSSSSDPSVYEHSKTYLDSLRNTVARYDLEQQIMAQEEAIKKADKKNTDYREEGKDLEKKKRKLEDQIADNIKDQANQVKELEKQRQILEVLKRKRK
ncbi:hypothetical protein BH11BAC4_BH11BAC4_15730 [soil metagenome]